MDLKAALERAQRAEETQPPVSLAKLEPAVEESVAYLGSEQARRDTGRDPYWPKWVVPWWHMTLLDELGLAGRIPRAAAERLAAVLNDHYIHFFPFRESDAPAGIDFKRNVICHCALGTAYRVLHRCGIDVDARIPWAREWILRYQLPDGGLNCDEEAYVRPTPRSSMVSTLPPAEALLLCTERPLDARERAFLSGVATYLTRRALAHSLSRDRIINPAWLTPCFPRFYFYDTLRGLRFLAAWAERTGATLPADAIAEPCTTLDAWFSATPRLSPHQPHVEQGTIAPDPQGQWPRLPTADSFPLLDRVIPSGAAEARLRREWREVLETLAPDRVE